MIPYIKSENAPKTKLICWIFLIIALSVNMLSIDIYLPAMPTLMIDLSTTSYFLKFIFIVNFIEFSISPLIFGSLADINGRKPALYICLMLALIGQLLSVFSFNSYSLMVFRIIQYLGAGALSSIILTLICDNFEGEKRAKAIAMFEISLPLALAFGPFLGAFILDYMGWRESFLILAGIQFLCLAGITFTFSETLVVTSKIKIKQTVKCISDILKDSISFRIILILGLAEGTWMIFTISSAFFYIKSFNVSLMSYAYYQTIPVVCFLLGASLYRTIIGKISSMQTFHISVIGYIFFGGGLFLFKKGLIIPTPITLCFIIAAMNFCCGIICPSGNSIVLDRVNKVLIGTSAGVIACIINLIVGISMLVGNYVTDTKLSIGFYNCLLCFVSFIGALSISFNKDIIYRFIFPNQK